MPNKEIISTKEDDEFWRWTIKRREKKKKIENVLLNVYKFINIIIIINLITLLWLLFTVTVANDDDTNTKKKKKDFYFVYAKLSLHVNISQEIIFIND